MAVFLSNAVTVVFVVHIYSEASVDKVVMPNAPQAKKEIRPANGISLII
jgi:hypothetical protein